VQRAGKQVSRHTLGLSATSRYCDRVTQVSAVQSTAPDLVDPIVGFRQSTITGGRLRSLDTGVWWHGWEPGLPGNRGSLPWVGGVRHWLRGPAIASSHERGRSHWISKRTEESLLRFLVSAMLHLGESIPPPAPDGGFGVIVEVSRRCVGLAGRMSSDRASTVNAVGAMKPA